MVGEEISELMSNQRSLENQYEAVMSQEQGMKSGRKSALGKDLRNSTHTVARSLKQNPLTPDNLDKVQADR